MTWVPGQDDITVRLTLDAERIRNTSAENTREMVREVGTMVWGAITNPYAASVEIVVVVNLERSIEGGSNL